MVPVEGGANVGSLYQDPAIHTHFSVTVTHHAKPIEQPGVDDDLPWRS